VLEARGIAYGLRMYDEVEKTANEVAEKLALAPEIVFKTLLVRSGREFALAVVPSTHELSLRRLARAWGRPSAEMADPKDIQRVTGYLRGSVSPIGIRRKLAVFIDESARVLPQMAVSAGARGVELLCEPEGIAAGSGGTFAEICQEA
jgi:Cys-tRNA(Pro)/Cys-tRNA(Cys) deacylase